MGTNSTSIFIICPSMCSTCTVQDICYSCHYSTYAKNGVCIKWPDCNPGYHIVSQNGTHGRLCKACRPTFFTNKKNEHFCTSWKTCLKGEFRINGSTTEDATCNNCRAGTFSDKATSIACSPCPKGTFSKAYATSCKSWRVCRPGTHVSRQGTNSTDRACSSCQKGRFTSANSQSACTIWRTCARGEIISQDGTTELDRACKVCDRGRYANGSRCMHCPHGSYCTNGVRNQCPLGRYGKFLVTDQAVMEAACEMCPTGRYGIIQDPNEEKACTNCPPGRYNNQPGLAKTSDLKDYCPEGCPAGQYLDGKRCIACPDGGYCPGGTGISGVRAMAGYWRVPNTTSFVPCLNPCSCLGALNPSSTCLEAKTHHKEGCNVQKGYLEGSRLCAGCRSGYSRDGRGTCNKCDDTVNVMVLILGILALLFCLAFLVWFTVIKRGGTFKTSEGAKKIFISYLQLTALSMTMDIPWPANFIGVFRTQAMVSSVGDKVIDFRCMISNSLTIAETAYFKTLLYALLPLGLSFLSVIVWRACGKRLVDPNKVRPMMAGTIVLMLYLIYPSVSTSALSLWKCEYIENVGSIFVVDPETLCTDKVHTQWVHGLALPSVVLYVLGLPTIAVLFLFKFRNKLDEPNTKIRLGLLYNGYRREHYLHEIWVVMRKLVIIVIGIFTNELQVLLALGAVAILLTHTVLAQPFQTASLSRLEIMLLSCCFLTLWVGGIFVVYPDCNGRGGLNAVCLIAEVSVFFLNIFCVVIGIGTYAWFAWLQRRDQLKGSVKAVCATLSKSRIFCSCCKSNFRLCLRSDQSKSMENPLSKSVELEVSSGILEDYDHTDVAKLRERIRELEGENKRLQNANKQLQENVHNNDPIKSVY